MSIIKNKEYKIQEDFLYIKARDLFFKALRGEDFSSFELINRLYLLRERQYDNRINGDDFLKAEEPKKYKEYNNETNLNFRHYGYLRAWRDLYNHAENENTESFSKHIKSLIIAEINGDSLFIPDLFLKRNIQSEFTRFLIIDISNLTGIPSDIDPNQVNNLFDQYIFPKMIKELEGKRLYFKINKNCREKYLVEDFQLPKNEVKDKKWIIKINKSQVKKLSNKNKITYNTNWITHHEEFAILKFEFGNIQTISINKIKIEGRLYFYPLIDTKSLGQYKNEEGIIYIENFIEV